MVIVFTPTPVPRFKASVSVSVPMLIVPVEPVFSVRSFVVRDSIVIAPAPVMFPMFTRFPEASILCVPAAAPVFMPVIAFTVPGALKSDGIDRTGVVPPDEVI